MSSTSPGVARRALTVAIGQILAAGAFSAHAATITVDDTSGTTGGGGCTIRDALTAANTDVVVAGCGAGSGGDTISLPTGATITLDTVDNGYNCLPLVSSEVTIAGNGSTIQRSDVGPECRLLEVNGAGSLTLDNLTLSNGVKYSPGGPPPPQRSSAGPVGGGVLCDNGSMVITGSTISGNTADAGGGIGLYNCTLDLIDSTVTGNTANRAGGGIYLYGNSTLYSLQSNVTLNNAGIGGGVYIYAYNVIQPPRAATVIERVRNFERGAEGRNRLGDKYGTALFIESTVSGNSATGFNPDRGPGLTSSGGGLFAYGGFAYFYDSRVEDNQADFFGGGTGSKYGGVAHILSTVTGNTGGIGGGAGGAFSYEIAYQSTFNNNEALIGGAMGFIYGLTGLVKSTVSGNRAVDGSLPGVNRGGGGYGSAGGLYGFYSALITQDSTVSGNTAEAEAGAIAWGKYGSPLFASGLRVSELGLGQGQRQGAQLVASNRGNKYTSAVLRHTTVAFNSAGGGPGGAFAVQFDTANPDARGGGFVGLINSIIANPGVGDCVALDSTIPDVVITTLIRDGSCGATFSGDPLLGPLANNGGPTLTHGLFNESPGVDAGDPAACASSDTTDQIGNPRPTDGVTPCSIGSTQGAILGPFGGVAVPTLGEWARMLMAGLLVVTAFFGIRRRRTRPVDSAD